MNIIYHDLHTILTSNTVQLALSTLIVAFCYYLKSKINLMKQKEDLEFAQNYDMLKSTKRSSLRAEYLQIYNSTVLTNKQKYDITRDLIETYETLEGNHYIHELDSKLKTYAEVHPNLIWKGHNEDETIEQHV